MQKSRKVRWTHLQSFVLQQSQKLLVDQMGVYTEKLHHLTGRDGANDVTSENTASVASSNQLFQIDWRRR